MQYGTVGFGRAIGDVEDEWCVAGKLADGAEQFALVFFRVVV